MAVATYLKFALFVLLISVESLEALLMDPRNNMEEYMQKIKPCGTQNFNRRTHFSPKFEKRGNKAALLDMVDYMNFPGSATDDIKSQAQFMCAWKNILKKSK